MPGHMACRLKATVTFESIHITLCLEERKYHKQSHVEIITVSQHHKLSIKWTKVQKCPIDKNGKHIFFHT